MTFSSSVIDAHPFADIFQYGIQVPGLAYGTIPPENLRFIVPPPKFDEKFFEKSSNHSPGVGNNSRFRPPDRKNGIGCRLRGEKSSSEGALYPGEVGPLKRHHPFFLKKDYFCVTGGDFRPDDGPFCLFQFGGIVFGLRDGIEGDRKYGKPHNSMPGLANSSDKCKNKYGSSDK